MVNIQIRSGQCSSTSCIDWSRRYGGDGFIVCSHMYPSSSEASVRIDSLDSTSIRVRRQTQQRKRVRSSPFPWIVLLRPWMYSTRTRSQLKSKRGRPHGPVEVSLSPLNRLDSWKKPIYFIATRCGESVLSSLRPPISPPRLLLFIDSYIIIYNTIPWPLLRKQEYQQIPYLHFYSSCPLTDYATVSWVKMQYLSMRRTFELKLRRYLSAFWRRNREEKLTISPEWGDR